LVRILDNKIKEKRCIPKENVMPSQCGGADTSGDILLITQVNKTPQVVNQQQQYIRVGTSLLGNFFFLTRL